MSFYSKYKSKIRKIRRKIVLLVLFPPLLLFIFLFRILPISWVRLFAAFSGKYFYRFATKSREWALANLERIYGDTLAENERIGIAKASFTEILTGFFDYMAYSHVKDASRYFRLIEVDGEEHLRNAYHRGKGVICLIPHMSSWEFAAITPPMLGYATSAASQSMKNESARKTDCEVQEQPRDEKYYPPGLISSIDRSTQQGRMPDTDDRSGHPRERNIYGFSRISGIYASGCIAATS